MNLSIFPHISLFELFCVLFQILDYTQYYLDLSNANANPKSEADWAVEYTFSTYYRINNITALSLHNLAEKLTQSTPNDNDIFNR